MIKRTLMIATLMLSQLVCASAVAQELSPYSATRVMRANELAQDDKISEAIEQLKGIKTSRAYDQAFIARMLGVFYWQAEQLPKAIEQITIAVDSGLLKDEQAWHTQKMLADLLLGEQEYTKALKYYYPLLENAPEPEMVEQIQLRITQSHYQAKQWHETLTAVAALHKLVVPDVASYSLKLGAELHLEQWQGAIGTLKKLVDLEPEKDQWWTQLVGLELRVGDEKSAFNHLTLAKQRNIELSQQELRLLSQLYAKHGVPEQAARQIAQLDNAKTDVKLLREQATYWQQAREWDRATHVWLQAAKYEPDYHWNAAQIMLQQQRYQAALAVLDKVPAREEQVALAKTRAYYKLDKLDQAIVQAKLANNISPSSQAKSWVKYLGQLRRAHG
ncbi:tetratricopeptide repeat protein [Vibrio sp. WXL103]|uniref:tetratricopeptide repeat protein n=1 Tax=Vibrio sp. WXL103 TaxID=3450710 RepID=UPI003EC80FFD